MAWRFASFVVRATGRSSCAIEQTETTLWAKDAGDSSRLLAVVVHSEVERGMEEEQGLLPFPLPLLDCETRGSRRCKEHLASAATALSVWSTRACAAMLLLLLTGLLTSDFVIERAQEIIIETFSDSAVALLFERNIVSVESLAGIYSLGK